jgi:methylenetetrahydrofolate reductase (NADPH)
MTTTNEVTLSFEIFPPKNDTAADTLAQTLADLAPVPASFLSVTSGASGSAARATAEQALAYGDALGGVPPRPHLTCVQASRREMEDLVGACLDVGIDRFVAIRGDAPPDQPVYTPRADGFAYADDLTLALKRWGARDVAVGAYPEVHPDADDGEHCLDVLKRKMEVGADRIITQYCFDTDQVLRWADAVRTAGIDAPIGIGVMPVHNYAQIKRFSDRCGAGVPQWLTDALADFEPGSSEAIDRAADIAAEQCRRLIRGGLTHLHVYTLNRSALTLAILRRLEAGPEACRWAA